MDITVVSSSPEVSREELIAFGREEGRRVDDAGGRYMEFPEKVEVIHPFLLLKYIRKIVNECIEANRNMYIITWNDSVFNAIRLAVMKSRKNVNAKCIQLLDEGKIVVGDITHDGRMSEWGDGIFDSWDKALMELL